MVKAHEGAISWKEFEIELIRKLALEYNGRFRRAKTVLQRRLPYRPMETLKEKWLELKRQNERRIVVDLVDEVPEKKVGNVSEPIQIKVKNFSPTRKHCKYAFPLWRLNLQKKNWNPPHSST